MDMKKYLLATVSGFVVLFLLAWVGHELVIPGLVETNPMESIERESPLMAGIIIAYLVIALIMAYIYPRGIEGESVFGNGIRFGVLMGLFISLPISLILYSTIADAEIIHVFVESVWHMIEEGAGGVTIAYVYGIEAGETEEQAETPVGNEPSSGPGDF